MMKTAKFILQKGIFRCFGGHYLKKILIYEKDYFGIYFFSVGTDM